MIVSGPVIRHASPTVFDLFYNIIRRKRLVCFVAANELESIETVF